MFAKSGEMTPPCGVPLVGLDIKEARQVGIVDLLPLGIEVFRDLPNGSIETTFGPEPMRAVKEVRLKDGFNNQLNRRIEN